MGPEEVVVAPVIVVSHGPPESSLEGSSDQDGVVSSADVVLVWREGGSWELEIIAVGLVDLHQELSVVLFLQFKIFFLVFWIGKVLCKLLNLLRKTF